MTSNVFEEDTKQLILYPVGTSNELELGGTSWEKRMQNNLNSFQEPSLDAEGGGTRAQNLNQIEENHIFNALINDSFIELSDINTGISTKEEAEIVMDNYFKGNTRVTIEYGHITRTGYLTEYNVEETSQNDLSTFRMTFTLLVAEPMSGGD